ncbi:MAG: enoyl-CoA hydratase-related protein [Pseudomonadota bacterium]
MTATAEPAVLVRRLPGHVALVTLNRPQVRNAVNAEVALGLDAAVAELEADDDIRAVVLTGAGPDFCAGADLKAVAQTGDGEALRTARGGFAGFVEAPRAKPWIAAVNGRALAGGCEIMLACDLIVASDNSQFGLPEVQRGLLAVAGGITRLPRVLPPLIALELILTGERLDVQRAAHYGMVNRVVPVADVVEEALRLARAIAANAPISVREGLRIAKTAIQPAAEMLRAVNAQGWDLINATEDLHEGVRAFAEKREPRWSGR